MSPLISSALIFIVNGLVTMIYTRKNPDKKIKIIALISLFVGGVMLMIGCGLSV